LRTLQLLLHVFLLQKLLLMLALALVLKMPDALLFLILVVTGWRGRRVRRRSDSTTRLVSGAEDHLHMTVFRLSLTMGLLLKLLHSLQLLHLLNLE
jgi:hypothetical protein